MKRYITFVFDGDERHGGWDDVLRVDGRNGPVLSFDTPEEAESNGIKNSFGADPVVEVVDLDKGESVRYLNKRGDEWVNSK